MLFNKKGNLHENKILTYRELKKCLEEMSLAKKS